MGQNRGVDPISLLFKLASQTGELMVLTRMASVWANFAMGPLCKDKMRFFLLSYSIS